MLLSWSSFSTQDTTKVLLPTPIAKLIAKDLLEGDLAKEKVFVLDELVGELESKLNTKSEIIKTQEIQLSNLDTAIYNMKSNLEYQIKISDAYEKSYLIERRKSRIIIPIVFLFGILVGSY